MRRSLAPAGETVVNALDLKLFLLLNAGEGLAGWHRAAAEALAADAVLVLPIALAVLWARGPLELRPRITQAVLAMALALALSALVSIAWYVPRPFVAGHGYAYLGRASDSSFPDHHVGVAGALALALLAAPRNGWIGLLVLALALLVGWARVFLGVEYPFDVLGGLAIALVANLALAPLRPLVESRLTPHVEQWYRTACRRLIAAGYVKR
jgi:undecaprenyl-diphosphatase